MTDSVEPRDRDATKRRFLTASGFADAERHPLPGDASTRRYERLIKGGKSFMLMDQPPALESQPCGRFESDEERRASGYNAMARLAAGRPDLSDAAL
ncbi:MAG: aminoglycoside phosphotransferase, partial [Asticcacaulis sp.]|nr:aminoglycoside phosphotransferase [Asticcacaulis sp.]